MASEKIKVLVNDEKGHFLRMFSKELTGEFELSENSILLKSEIETTTFDRYISVVYNKAELIDFLAFEKKEINILVCLFNKRLSSTASFIEEINELIGLDGYKTKRAIVKDLKLHLKQSSGSKHSTTKETLQVSKRNKKKLNSTFKTVFFLI